MENKKDGKKEAEESVCTWCGSIVPVSELTRCKTPGCKDDSHYCNSCRDLMEDGLCMLCQTLKKYDVPLEKQSSAPE